MSEFSTPKKPGLDIHEVPRESKYVTLQEIALHFERQLNGKVLSMHFVPSNAEPLVTHQEIKWNGVLSNGVVAIMVKDALGQPSMHEFKGDKIYPLGSMYKAGDFWFKDVETDDTVWWGIYDSPVKPSYIILDNDESQT